jgi:hypothetical protein
VQKISRKDPKSSFNISNEDAFYIVGFVDGEGSFNISFKIRKDYIHKIQVYPSFNISQKEKRILGWIHEILDCGTIRNRGDGVYYYEVHSLKDLVEKVIPFFQKYKLKTKKRKSFLVFTKIVMFIYLKKELSFEDIQKIYLLREQIRVGRKRKYSLIDLRRIWKSSETIRQTELHK